MSRIIINKVEELKMNHKKTGNMHYVNKDTDINHLIQKIMSWAKNKKLRAQLIEGDVKWLIQIRKNNWARTVVAANRSLDIIIKGTSNNFTIQIVTGKWLNNIAMTGVIAFFTCGAAAAIGGINTLWIIKMKNDLKKLINTTIEFERHN